MEISFAKNDPLHAHITIKVGESDYKPLIDKKLKELGKNAQIKGFRQGKVPPALIQKMYGRQLRYQEINALLEKSLKEYVATNDMPIFGSPLPTLESYEKIDWDNNQDIEMTYEAGIKPEISILIPENATLKNYQIEVVDKDIDDYVDQLLYMAGDELEQEVIDIESIIIGTISSANGESVTVAHGDHSHTYFGTDDKKTPILLYVKNVEESQQATFIGKNLDDDITFNVETDFPKRDTLAQALRLGLDTVEKMTGDYVLHIEKIKMRTKGDANEDFFTQQLGSEYADKSIEGLKTYVKNALENIYNYHARVDKIVKFKNMIYENNKDFELPDGFLKRWLLVVNNSENRNVSMEDIEKAYDVNLKRTIQWDMIKERLIAEGNIEEISKEEMINYGAKMYMSRYVLEYMMIANYELMANSMSTMTFGTKKIEDMPNEMRNVYNSITEDLMFEKVLSKYDSKLALESETITWENFQMVDYHHQ